MSFIKSVPRGIVFILSFFAYAPTHTMLFKIFSRTNPVCSITQYIRAQTGLENARIILHKDSRFYMGIMRRPFGRTPLFVVTTGFYDKMKQAIQNNFSKKDDTFVKEMFDASATHETGHWVHKDLDRIFFVTKKEMHNAEYNADRFAVEHGHAEGLKKIIWYTSSLSNSLENHFSDSLTHPSFDSRICAIDKISRQIKYQKKMCRPLLLT